MSDIAASSPRGRFSVHFSLRHGQVLAWASLFLFAVFWNQALGWLNPDASWLIHAAHRVLDGERLHVDVWDTNPPFSVWLYLPMAWLENLTGLRAELWTSLFMFASVAVGLGLSALILRRAGLQTPTERFTLLFIIAAALLLIMPGEFAQREHFGTALALPLLFIYACRTVGGAPLPVWASVLAGAMASLLLLVKPFYAAGFLLPVLYRLLVARDWKLLFIPAHFAGAAIVLAYGASLLFVFTDYVDVVMPLVVEFYLPARAPLFMILEVSATIILPVAIVTMLIGWMSEEKRTGLAVFILAAISFLVSVYMNGKAFPYHFLPVVVCLFAVLGLRAAPIIVSGLFPTRKRWLVGFASAATIGLTLLRLDIYTYREMPITDEVRALGNEVRLVGFGPNLAISNPMARKLGAHWTERENSDLLAALIKAHIGLGRDDESGRMRKLLDAAVARKVAYMRDNDVNFVLLDHKSLQWSRFVMQQPEILRALAGFRSVGCFEGTSYLVRDGLAPDEVPGADWGGILEDECIAAGEIDPVVANGN